MKTPISILAVVAIAFLGWPAPTLSNEAEGDELLRIAVPFADLNMMHPDGAKALYSRIREAARQVCGVRIGPQSPQERRVQSTCFAEAVADAVKQVNRQQLTAMHDAAIARAG